MSSRGANALGAGQENVTSIRPEAAAMLKDFFGSDISEQQARDMVGAGQGARVGVGVAQDYTSAGEVPAVRFTMRGPNVPVPTMIDNPQNPEGPMIMGTRNAPLYSGERFGFQPAERTLYRAPNGSLEMHNVTLRIPEEYQGKGVGLQVFAKQAKTLSAMGVKTIGAEMGGWRGSSDQGYRVWPRMGYNSKPGQIEMWAQQFIKDKSVPSGIRNTIKSIGAKNATLLDLYATPEGRAWWGQHGGNTEGWFDLAPGSRSMQVLQAYAAEKGLDWNAL